MSLQGPIPVEFGAVFPSGAYAAGGFEPVRNFDASTGEKFVQSTDKATGAALWVIEVAALLWPTGMVSVLNGSIDDGYSGLLGWFWLACVVTTIALCFVTRAALKERAYSAVMAATGLLYLAILTAFGTDLVARAVLAK